MAERVRRWRGRSGRLGPRVFGGGARTRRRGVRSRWRRRWCVRALSPAPLRLGEEAALAWPRSRATDLVPRTAGRMRGVAGEPAGFAGGEGLVGVEVGQPSSRPLRTLWSMVTTTVAAVFGCRWSVGGARAARRTRARGGAASRTTGPRRADLARASVGVRSSCRGSCARIAAARAGTVKCPVVVPSPLSCSVSEHLSRAACSSERMSSFSWASTTLWSGSTASIARRAMRRSWSGLNRPAFATETGFNDLALLRAHRLRQLARGLHDHRRVPGGDQASVERFGGGVVAGGQLGGQCDLPGRIRAGHRGGLRDPGVGVGEPGVLRGAGLVGGGDHLELQRLQPPDRAVHLGHRRRVLGSNQRLSCAGAAGRSARAGLATPSRAPRRCCRGGGRGVLPWLLFFLEHMFESRVRIEMWTRKGDLEDRNHSGRVKRR